MRVCVCDTIGHTWGWAPDPSPSPRLGHSLVNTRKSEPPPTCSPEARRAASLAQDLSC